MKGLALDFETANHALESACALGVVSIEEGCVEEVLSTLIQPHPTYGHFSSFNIAIHGIHPEEVEDAPTWPEVYESLCPLLEGSLVMAHNASFDMAVLQAVCRLYQCELPDFRYFDTLELGRKLFPSLSHHKLNDLCDYLGVQLDHHQAASDANGCAMILVNAMVLTEIFDMEELLTSCGCHIYSSQEMK